MHERARREARLAVLDEALARDAAHLPLAFERATVLDALGRTNDARAAYLYVLERDTTHLGALNEFGRLLERTGFHSAARMVFARAVAVHPADAVSRGNLATALLDAGETDAARREFEAAVALDPQNVAARQCLAMMLLRAGDELGARRHARIGFRDGATHWPYRGEGTPIDVLVLHSALGGNVPIERYLDDRTFAKATLVAEFDDRTRPLPPHALVVNTIGDASRCAAALAAARAILARTSAPVVNDPRRVAATTREANAAAFAAVANVRAPLTAVFARAALGRATAAESLMGFGFRFPIIVRAPGYHSGEHCVKAETLDELIAAVETLPGNEILAIAYIETRARDGFYRKYRAMIVDGEIYPLHLAIASQWLVHYFRADASSDAHRAEEGAFLADMAAALGATAIAALRAIAERLGLDYGGIDFAIDAAGRVVVFEANATMFVPPPSVDDRPIHVAAVERIDAAVRTMLLSRSG